MCVFVGLFCFKDDRLVGIVVEASASRAEDPGFESRLRRVFFQGRVIPVVLQWLPCQALGVIGSALALVGPAPVCCDPENPDTTRYCRSPLLPRPFFFLFYSLSFFF